MKSGINEIEDPNFTKTMALQIGHITGVLKNLMDYQVQYLAFDTNHDSQYIHFFRSQPTWDVIFDDGEGVVFEIKDQEVNNGHCKK